MSTIINTRSPYFIKFIPPSANEITSVTINIKIWDGLSSAPPSTNNYVITKTPVKSEIDNYVTIEISELIRDYLVTEYYDQSIDALWVQVNSTINLVSGDPITNSDLYLAFDGYGDFNVGVNPRTSVDPTTESYTPQTLIDNRTIYFKRGEDIKIPLFSEPESNVVTTISGVWNFTEEYWDLSNINWDSTSTPIQIDDSLDSEDKIQYLIIDSTNALTGDTITITSTVGNLQTDVITLKEIDCDEYDNYRVVFYNKYGALQDVYMPKKSNETVSVKSESYKRNIFNSETLSYNALRHQDYTLNVNGNKSITVNSDFLLEEFNEVFEQLFLSEQVWLSLVLDVYAVKLKSKSFNYKTVINDRLIQYSLDLEYANNFINAVR